MVVVESSDVAAEISPCNNYIHNCCFYKWYRTESHVDDIYHEIFYDCICQDDITFHLESLFIERHVKNVVRDWLSSYGSEIMLYVNWKKPFCVTFRSNLGVQSEQVYV